MPKKCNCPTPPPPQYQHCPVEDKLWERIKRKFATNEAVIKLANDIRKVNSNISIKASEAATVAAGLVLQQIGTDIDALNTRIDHVERFNIELVESDENGHPRVFEPDFHTLYLTRASYGDPDRLDNQWDEWLAIPGAGDSFDWEHIGAKTIDLSWVNNQFESINEKLAKLNCKINNLSHDIAKALVERAVRPLTELSNYIHSQEFIDYINSQIGTIPIATLNNDGLMSSSMVYNLEYLWRWATLDKSEVGGGAMGADYVEEMFNN